MRRYEKILREYFKKHKTGTVWDVINYMKSKRVKKGRGNTPNSFDRGLLIPTANQVRSYMKKVGAKKLGKVRVRPRLKLILWGMDFQ